MMSPLLINVFLLYSIDTEESVMMAIAYYLMLTSHFLFSLQIDNVLRQMPNLTFLNLSHNNMRNAAVEPLTRMEKLRSLVLNHTYVPWNIVSSFLDAMPK